MATISHRQQWVPQCYLDDPIPLLYYCVHSSGYPWRLLAIWSSFQIKCMWSIKQKHDLSTVCSTPYILPYPDSKVHGANMGPTWVLSAPDGPHVGPMNLALRVCTFLPYLPYLPPLPASLSFHVKHTADIEWQCRHRINSRGSQYQCHY